MKGTDYLTAINNIDEELLEMADKCKNGKKWGGVIKLASCVAACIAVACAITVIPRFAKKAQPTETDASGAGGIAGKINVRSEIQMLGTDFPVSNEEGYAFLEQMSEAIRGELRSSGVKMTDFRIDENGYSHVRTGDSGNSMAVDWRDYLIYDGNEIIAVASVTKDENGLHYYTVWGSPGFRELGEFLLSHKGEKLVAVWVGDVDAIITPENEVFCLSDISMAIDEKDRTGYYEYFKTKYNTFVPQ